MRDGAQFHGEVAGTHPVPAARSGELITTRAGDDVLIYDPVRHHIHQLNRTAAVVWSLCDGQRSVPEIARQSCLMLGAAVDEEMARGAIASLAAAQLLEPSPAWRAPDGPGRSRRVTRRQAVVAGAAIVVSMTVPSAADAQSPTCDPPCPECRKCVGVMCVLDPNQDNKPCSAGYCYGGNCVVEPPDCPGCA